MKSLTNLVAAAGTLLLLSASGTLGQAPPALELSGDEKAGHLSATWLVEGSEAAALEYELQQGSSETFEAAETLYQGPHTASVISGLPNGAYYFRVRQRSQGQAGWSDWSAAKRFDIEHHSLAYALRLLALGAFVFVALLTCLLVSSRKARHG